MTKPETTPREWRDYPVGTRAMAIEGGHWIKQQDGRWRWHCGNAFPTPGGTVSAVRLPGSEKEDADGLDY